MTIFGYVTKADTKKIKVIVINSNIEKDLLNYGFVVEQAKEYSYGCLDENDKAEIFSKLNDLNIAFSTGREWSPSEVYEYLREKGILKGSYKRVAWISPQEFKVTEA